MTDDWLSGSGGNFSFGVYRLFTLLLHQQELVIKTNLLFTSLEEQ